MFKVICINNAEHTNAEVIDIPLGTIVTVDDTCNWNGDDYYHFSEYPTSNRGQRQWYLQRNFAPLSSIDETEMIREFNYEPA